MRVLIVEDEKDMAQVLKEGLEEENHRVSLAFDGVTGLEVARACDFDVIVLDVMLPKLDGFEIARRLRAEGKSHANLDAHRSRYCARRRERA
jgi:DNA-binding response OmpR family regulator